MSDQLPHANDYGILSAEINAAPERMRRFIHDLESRADPAGDVRRAFVAEENAMALQKRVEELERAQGWISVDERLPTHIHSMLGWMVISEENAWVDEPHADVVIYNASRGKWQCGSFLNGEDVDVTVTHWMELPNEPTACRTCNDRSEVGGFVNAESGYQTDPCPACSRGPLKLDTDRQVFFYEQDHYYLSNFSAFGLLWDGIYFPTSEHAYHWEKFKVPGSSSCTSRVGRLIYGARSAHEAFKIAERNKDERRRDWDDVKVDIMRCILVSKVQQHEYVARKLLETGDRELVENSWRDDFWGWGPNRDGQNMLGKLWMQIRTQMRALQTTSGGQP